MNDQLPAHGHEMIRVALRDLEITANDDQYRIDMGTWHTRMMHYCSVCLAGSVMAQTMKINPLNEVYSPIANAKIAESESQHEPGDIQPAIPALWSFAEGHRLQALDYFRRGWVIDGLEYMHDAFDGSEVYDAAIIAEQIDIIKNLKNYPGFEKTLIAKFGHCRKHRGGSHDSFLAWEDWNVPLYNKREPESCLAFTSRMNEMADFLELIHKSAVEILGLSGWRRSCV